jgi:hypothetical protein
LSALHFLEETLELWDIAGTVEVGEAPLWAVIRAQSGAIAWIERRSHQEAQFRWAVRWRGAGAAPGGPREVRPRMCGSLVGVLAALREALAVERGTPLRIAPGRYDASTMDSGSSPE